jgi:myo-inositol-1(or 4)-monophosphatase
VVNLWAPALDLALVADGTIDAMVCHNAALLDVCGGMFLVESAAGRVVTFDGTPLSVQRSLHERPVSFIAAQSAELVEELVAQVRALESGSGCSHSGSVPALGWRSSLSSHR